MNESVLSCSFCHQPKSKVEKLIVGEGRIAICNHCVALCYEVLRKEGLDMTLGESRVSQAIRAVKRPADPRLAKLKAKIEKADLKSAAS
jgi:ATP-dependent protease Clp ATPase subunit